MGDAGGAGMAESPEPRRPERERPEAPGAVRAAVTLRFQPSGAVVLADPGSTVLDAAARAGLPVEAPCGGHRLCGKCRVAFADGAPEPTAVERELVSAEDLAAGVRLACRVRPEAEATLRLLPPPRVDWW